MWGKRGGLLRPGQVIYRNERKATGSVPPLFFSLSLSLRSLSVENFAYREGCNAGLFVPGSLGCFTTWKLRPLEWWYTSKCFDICMRILVSILTSVNKPVMEKFNCRRWTEEKRSCQHANHTSATICRERSGEQTFYSWRNGLASTMELVVEKNWAKAPSFNLLSGVFFFWRCRARKRWFDFPVNEHTTISRAHGCHYNLFWFLAESHFITHIKEFVH